MRAGRRVFEGSLRHADGARGAPHPHCHARSSRPLNALTYQFWADLQGREREYTNVVRDLYAEGVASGDFVEMDITVPTATLLGGAIWVHRWFDRKGRLSPDDVAEAVARLLIDGALRR